MLLSKGWKLVSKSGEVATDPEGYDQELFALADGRVYSRRLATQPEASGLGDRGNHQESSEDITINHPGTSRVLLGSNDNRVAITNPKTIRTYPLRTIGAVSETETGRTGCTATLVGPRHAITAEILALNPGSSSHYNGRRLQEAHQRLMEEEKKN